MLKFYSAKVFQTSINIFYILSKKVVVKNASWIVSFSNQIKPVNIFQNPLC